MASAFHFNNLKAQTVGGTLSGTFACLTNKNNTGYQLALTTWKEGDSNQLFIINFPSERIGQVTGLVENTTINYETTNVKTVSEIKISPITFNVTPNNPVSYMYKMVDPTEIEKPFYFALANSGNTLLLMSAPKSIDSPTLNGVCQKV